MPDNELARKVMREWVAKAENDLIAARFLLEMGEGCPTDIVCFHAQQCVEKCLKAAIVLGDHEVPKTHDVEKLASLLSPQEVGLSAVEMRLLTGYAVEQRYPGYSPVVVDEARNAVDMAKRVREALQVMLRPDSHK